MKIGNIIYRDELVNHEPVQYVNYTKQDVKYEIIDKNTPTLYVGWKFLKEINTDDEVIQAQNISEKKIISNQLYWEFSYTENKAEHIDGINNFIKNIPEYYFSGKYTYINLDPVFFQIRDIDDLMDTVSKRYYRLYNYKNEMLYLLIDNKITGIDLKMYSHFKFDIEKIVSNLSDRTITCFSDLDGELYTAQNKIFPTFSHLKRYIIILLKNKD
jgi:hypothetical protein